MLDYDVGEKRLLRRFASRHGGEEIDSRFRENDKKGYGNDRSSSWNDRNVERNEIAALSSKARNDIEENQNLLVIAPTSFR